MRKKSKRLCACLAVLIGLSGCAIGGNQYYISVTESDAGSASPIITNTPSKTVDTSIGAAVSATAAASQQGDASNGGASSAEVRP